ncbi:hypothetical protein HY624_02970 [Candidatus Uhrbacteria bacterium]|nr:hypothetical protein [Candidatus Uhrbacteria bacterium]
MNNELCILPSEVQNQLIIARDVGYITEEAYKNAFAQSVVVHKLVNGLIKGARRIIASTA